MVMKQLSWKVKSKKLLLFRIEALFVAVLGILIFVGSFFYYYKVLKFPSSLWATLFVVALFVVLYYIISMVIKHIRQAEEHYLAQDTHLEITKTTKKKLVQVKVPWKRLNHHKLDKTFLGGYLFTKDKKRHPLFFNTKNEMVKFENFVKKVMEKKR
ncbi:hypothetical protein HYU21_01390 [Candidatus Woesearchaeota archaeon]|nr:hypothetical protein [Candidatus Woesearchaeota archaeon]